VQQESGLCSTYVYDPNEAWSPLARVDHLRDQSSGEIYWFNTDLNGAPLEVTDERGAVRWSGQYGSFGEVRHQSEGFSRLVNRSAMAHQPLRYAGQYADGETGLHYNLFRYYDPQVGRFIVQDPIGLNGGWNLYQYAPNPLGWIDPLGLNNCNTVKRAVTPEQMESIRAGNGITRPTPYHKTTPTQHVAGAPHSRDPWISTTRSQASAEYFATHGGTRAANPIIEIDLSKIPKDRIVDVSTAQKAAENLQTPFTRNAAAAHQEVLIFGEIPHEAIIFK